MPSNKYILEQLPAWQKSAERNLENYSEFYHYFLDIELGRASKKGTAYYSLEQWKIDINKLLIKNI